MTWYTACALLALTACVGIAIPRERGFAGGLTRHVSIPEITAAQLRKRQLSYETRLKQAEKFGAPAPLADFLVVDVRTEAESNVSVIPGALPLRLFEKDRDLYKGRTVICYCTIGVRSEKFARSLRHDGFNAWNFKGSILEWCKHHYPLVDLDGHSTRQVHTWSGAYSVPSDYEAVW